MKTPAYAPFRFLTFPFIAESVECTEGRTRSHVVGGLFSYDLVAGFEDLPQLAGKITVLISVFISLKR